MNNMKRIYLKKEAVVGIFFMLLMLSQLPISSAEAPAVEEIPTWGIILRGSCEVGYSEIWWNETWWGVPMIFYIVFGIGRHEIHWQLEYEIYTINSTEPQTGVLQGIDMIYLFDLNKKPIIKPRTKGIFEESFEYFDHGEWWGRIYIDGELYKEVSMSYDHQ
jgi:hypothetical protein